MLPFNHPFLQLTEKEKQLQEERRKLMEKKKLEDEEKARIKAQVISENRTEIRIKIRQWALIFPWGSNSRGDGPIV